MAHFYSDVVESTGEHLHTNVYPEKEGDKGSNNVALLIMKTLTNLNVLREVEAGRKLTIFLIIVQDKTKTTLFFYWCHI